MNNTEETNKCLNCGAKFLADELVMHQINENHTIGDWHCPYCGSLDYVEVFF